MSSQPQSTLDSARVLNVSPRDIKQTKSQIRALRLSGGVPCVLYGSGPSENLSVPMKEITRELESPGVFSRVFELPEYGKALISAIQFCNVKDRPLHVDFRRLSADQKVKLLIRVVFLHEDKSLGLKRGGALNVVHHHLEVLVPVEHIPESIEVDLSHLDIGETLHLDKIQLPKGVQVLHVQHNEAIVSIVPPSAEETSEAATEVSST